MDCKSKGLEKGAWPFGLICSYLIRRSGRRESSLRGRTARKTANWAIAPFLIQTNQLNKDHGLALPLK